MSREIEWRAWKSPYQAFRSLTVIAVGGVGVGWFMVMER
jgi:hypothetical protein